MYAVIGANGYLGSYVIKNILEQTSDSVIATAMRVDRAKAQDRVTWKYCDVTDAQSIEELVNYLKETGEPVKIVYLAAFHHPDEVQKNPTKAWNINVTSLSTFLAIISASGCCKSLVYSSTDSVYGESEDMYHFVETDPLNPVNFYGHCKCAAEALTVHIGYSVVRFPFLISPSLVYKPHFYDQIVDTVRNGNDMEMFKDSFRSSLSFDNAAYLLVKALEDGRHFEIMNICGDDDLSKYDVGLLIAEREGLDRNKIVPVGMMDKVQANFVSKRATSTLMSNEKLKEMLGIKRIDIFERPVFEK